MKINMHEFNECMAAIANGDPAARGKAIGDLAKYSGAEWEKSPDAIPQAVTALMAAAEKSNSRDPAVRLEAARALGNIGTQAPEVVPSLLKLLTHDSDEETRTEAARSLGKIGAKASAGGKALINVLKSNAGEALRGEAARALARVDPETPATATALRAAMSDRNGHVSVCAAEALWRVTSETEKVIPALVARLNDGRARDAAVQALYRIGTKAQAAVPALLAAAKVKDRLFRESVVMALKKIDPHAASQAVGM